MSTLEPAASTRPVRVSTKGLLVAGLRVSYVIAAVLTVVWAYLLVDFGIQAAVIGFDFRGTLWDPAVAVLEGRSPYPEPVRAEVDVGNPALYPPLLILFVAPLTVLPWSIGAALWGVLLIGGVAGALYALDVRDPRCYLFALLSPLVGHGVVLGNATLLLVPLVALAWRWRAHWARVGILVGLAIAAKLFLWPLLFWLLGTRRYRAFGAALVAACAGLFVPWAAIGFDGLSSYPELLRMAEAVYAAHSFSITTGLSGLGIGTESAILIGLALGVALAMSALYAGRRTADSAALSLALLAAVLASPIVWAFYYALLLIPVALARPRFSGLWAALTLFFVVERLPRERLSASNLVPGEVPEDVPITVWVFNHSSPATWPALGYAALGAALVAASVWLMLRSRSRPELAP